MQTSYAYSIANCAVNKIFVRDEITGIRFNKFFFSFFLSYIRDVRTNFSNVF